MEEKTIEKTETEAKKTAPTKPAAQPIIQREFEIAVYDITEDENTGKAVMKPVAFEKPMTITAASPGELKSKLAMYKATGQYAKVIREVGQKQVASAQPSNPMFQSQKDALPTMMNIANSMNSQYQLPANPYSQTAYRAPDPVPVKQKPRYFKVGDVEVKDDNGKIYQKQWVKLTDSEASNIRIVNDKNNAIVNLNGKHIEMKKWILIENSEDDTSDLEENL